MQMEGDSLHLNLIINFLIVLEYTAKRESFIVPLSKYLWRAQCTVCVYIHAFTEHFFMNTCIII